MDRESLGRESVSPPKLAQRWTCKSDKIVALIREGLLHGFDISSPGSKRPRFRILMSEVERFERERAPKPAKPIRRRRSAPAEAVEEFV